jgi:hypothetical protein
MIAKSIRSLVAESGRRKSSKRRAISNKLMEEILGSKNQLAESRREVGNRPNFASGSLIHFFAGPT